MADDMLSALMDAIDRRAAEDTTSLDEARQARSARTPDMNNPLAPVYQRPQRRTMRPYRDPVGEQAVGNIRKKEKRQ
ncbi:hypothetical protein [Brachybacterium massiliense]|uniref:hypothetical protein n=1 Tax=Brachybacterium massiliense TaxID=1755098 RepID=UPI000B3BC851|nr:hypothetical protein [Brachybacterium massiliense]